MIESSTKKTKILVVEDDVFMIELLVKELMEAGFDVVNAKTGAETFERLKEGKPDLILLDLLLPDEHGFEVLRKIRQMPDVQDVKVMVLSNLGEARDKEEAKQLGVLDYLVKANNSLPEIISAVRKLVPA